MLRKPNAFAAGSGSVRDAGDATRWIRIAQALLPQGVATHACVPYYAQGNDVGEDALLKAFVRILERPTETTALVLWRSAARCHYGEQLWIRGVATRAGSCAISGRAVKRGDRIYRPRRGRARISNALAVILASSIETDACAGG
jgi:Domain of unknown function (DUF3331)